MKFLNKEINKSPLFGLNGSDTINSLRNEALNEFNKQGLPNKDWEELTEEHYKYYILL